MSIFLYIVFQHMHKKNAFFRTDSFLSFFFYIFLYNFYNVSHPMEVKEMYCFILNLALHIHMFLRLMHYMQENVSSSEDIYSKTKSVIELKKLQLLELQRRLRR